MFTPHQCFTKLKVRVLNFAWNQINKFRCHPCAAMFHKNTFPPNRRWMWERGCRLKSIEYLCAEHIVYETSRVGIFLGKIIEIYNTLRYLFLASWALLIHLVQVVGMASLKLFQSEKICNKNLFQKINLRSSRIFKKFVQFACQKQHMHSLKI